MSIRKVFHPNYGAIAVLAFLIITYQLHLIQRLIGVNQVEEISIVTAVLWISETLPLYVTSLGVLFI